MELGNDSYEANMKARMEIGELYNVIREFKSEKLGSLLNPGLYAACEKMPELKALNDELYQYLLDLELKIIKFADDKYPIK